MILELEHHKLYFALGLTIVTLTLCGWKVFPMAKALRSHGPFDGAISPKPHFEVPLMPMELQTFFIERCVIHSYTYGTHIQINVTNPMKLQVLCMFG